MRLLADENIPLASIQILRAEGHDVLAASESMSGKGDREVLARAGEETAAILVDLLSDLRLTFSGKFTVVDRERVRQRSLQSEGKGG